MRRIEEDQRTEFSDLLRLNPAERLFVQRWVELFDRDVILGVRCRPFWRSKVLAELSQHGQSDYHVDLMKEEIGASPPASVASVEVQAIADDPVSAAEGLSLAASALGFDHRFLFHAYKAMLHRPEVPFRQRAYALRDWWLANSTPRAMSVLLRTTSGGFTPQPTADLGIVRWQDLDSRIQESAARCQPWWSKYEENTRGNCFFFRIRVLASDPNAAAALALEEHARYSTVPLGAKLKPIPVDQSWAFVDDPQQQPAGHTYALSLVGNSFRVRRPFSRARLRELADACAADQALQIFWQHFSAALQDIFAGRPAAALDDIAKVIDLACGDFDPGWKMGRPRLFVEVASILLALDWCSTHYSYIVEYLLAPSFAVPTTTFGGERRPAKIFDLISDHVSWEGYQRHFEWDELVKYRRLKVLEELDAPAQVLAERFRRERWDLARAVRARNLLFHRGQPLQDEYLLAILVEAFTLLMRLRLLAWTQRLPFSAVLDRAANDYAEIVAGAQRPDPRSFAAFGWRQWKSKTGNDL